MFITLEGPEGAGKSTVARRLQARLTRSGYSAVLTFEPGGTALGDQVRQIVLHASELAPTPRAETLLFCASRTQLVEEVVRPHLAKGEVVICDRYSDSTLAYQCYGRGLPLEPVRAVVDFATGGLRPDLTVLLDLDVAVGLRRKRGRGNAPWDRFELAGIEFAERVRQGYHQLATVEPERWLVLDAGRPLAEVEERVWERVQVGLRPD